MVSRYYQIQFLDFLFQASRSVAGSTIIIFMLSNGVGLSDIALLKIIGTVAIVFFDIPSGMVSDRISHRVSLIFSSSLGVIAFFLIAVGNGLEIFIVAEILLSASLAFWSGAYDAFAISHLNMENDKLKIREFFHSNTSIRSVATILFGYIGGFIYATYLKASPMFSASIISFTTILFIFCIGSLPGRNPVYSKSKAQQDFYSIFKKSIHYGTIDKNTRILFLLFLFINFFVTPLINYWQPFFEKLIVGTSFHLGIVHLAFHSSIFVSSLILAKSVLKDKIGEPLSVLGLAVLLAFSLFMLSVSTSFFQALIVFCVVEIIFVALSTSIRTDVSAVVSPDFRATALSALSTFSKIGVFSSLFMIKILFEGQSESNKVLSEVFEYSSMVLLGTISIYIFYVTYKVLLSRFKRKYKET